MQPDTRALKVTALALMGVSIRKLAFDFQFETPKECHATIVATRDALQAEVEAIRDARV
ncbi:hypothetical protein [Rhodococcus ruber]|uniref:hypothetical protein n=1 Tax=Rhodococcus ruber TaxID=1830 RepID=UPI00034AB9E7|nr:hypothetical protein [Rhodococcus ruber]